MKLDINASDKSLSHRAVIFSLLAQKPCFVRNFLMGEDCLSSLEIAQNLGAKVENIAKNSFKITPPKTIKEPNKILNCNNSGTSMRLYSGLLSAQKGLFVLSGDNSLNSRPMKRIIEPLKAFGARILGREDNHFAPLAIVGSPLKACDYESPIASAQVKSAFILSALQAQGISAYKESELSRNHTEIMLKSLGANVQNQDGVLKISPLEKPLEAFDFTIANDPSSAFFFALACAITPKSHLLLKNVLLNPTRIEAFEVLKKMGASIEYAIKSKDLEIIGDIYIEHAPLKAIAINQNTASLIDEIPALSIAMLFAKGKSMVKNAKDLRAKESDRIKAVVSNFKALGIECEEFEDGFYIEGLGDASQLKQHFSKIKPPIIKSFNDHRIAMSFAVLTLILPLEIDNLECANISFPTFQLWLNLFKKRSLNGN
ncbi:3-phosphoshikimate 1-carboxyvinyltransferase [Helicobacter pylori]|uniref:3-phosphoshikimate 1-carboxyvinyltransferase n=1 Tax=Helicobacter pylori HP260AFii TaxID=1159077 RepID=A0ABC9SB59_HELPX|nr:3-phosphoshikimate 1-carboxyvinyltransferase [Helicobacter pylori]EMH21399.1 3-phosphoshikimate 1-carboxyvinyltransferase [Helicobacter pylori GAM260ASi]EMH26748.1 3-phosphoshikimate 1-carboxyvinyltransferase [Helicobacter pylori GAM268Bii]EMH64759.1 3-phosphoshikimate 1-carboxyvinyltransferase [Helicobacter pylori HP260AFi]EMH68371.1 3-phosphoshikimate 1-carboxyvinyltransferase [Helicobacter pylori HP260AFii]EMH69772.1 3-phosphoshikimate 1-carboxyvinyltransferase [Helicobacter pylori HP260